MSSGLIQLMKIASMDAMKNSQPCDLRYGTVKSISPLKIQISNQLTLTEAFLVVPKHLTNYTVSVGLNWGTSSAENHSHSVSGGSMTINNALKVGDKVALLRETGGQSYLVLDRV